MKITFIALFIGATIAVQAQSSSKKYNAQEEMNQEMQLIVNGLGLQTMKINQLGQLMEKKRLQKESLLEQLDQIKKQLVQLEANSQKEMKGMLTPSEWNKYQEEIKPKIDKITKEHMDRLKE